MLEYILLIASVKNTIEFSYRSLSSILMSKMVYTHVSTFWFQDRHGKGERYKVLLYSNVIILNKMVFVYKPDDKRFNPLDESLESLEEQLPRWVTASVEEETPLPIL